MRTFGTGYKNWGNDYIKIRLLNFLPMKVTKLYECEVEERWRTWSAFSRVQHTEAVKVIKD